MSQPYTLFDNVANLLPPITPDSIVSRTIYQDANLRVILFGFAAGQELSEHTSARQVVLHFLRGDASLTLGGEPSSAQAGTLVNMEPHLPHSVHAVTETVMLLYMFGK